MKRLYFFLALTVALFATSCQNCFVRYMAMEDGYFFVEFDDSVTVCNIVYPQEIIIDCDKVSEKRKEIISLNDSASCGIIVVDYDFHNIEQPTEIDIEVQVQRLKGTGKCTYYFVKKCPDDPRLDYNDSRLHSWIRNNCDTKFTLSDDDVHTIKITI